MGLDHRLVRSEQTIESMAALAGVDPQTLLAEMKELAKAVAKLRAEAADG